MCCRPLDPMAIAAAGIAAKEARPLPFAAVCGCDGEWRNALEQHFKAVLARPPRIYVVVQTHTDVVPRDGGDAAIYSGPSKEAGESTGIPADSGALDNAGKLTEGSGEAVVSGGVAPAGAATTAPPPMCCRRRRRARRRHRPLRVSPCEHECKGALTGSAAAQTAGAEGPGTVPQYAIAIVAAVAAARFCARLCASAACFQHRFGAALCGRRRVDELKVRTAEFKAEGGLGTATDGQHVVEARVQEGNDCLVGLFSFVPAVVPTGLQKKVPSLEAGISMRCGQGQHAVEAKVQEGNDCLVGLLSSVPAVVPTGLQKRVPSLFVSALAAFATCLDEACGAVKRRRPRGTPSSLSPSPSGREATDEHCIGAPCGAAATVPASVGARLRDARRAMRSAAAKVARTARESRPYPAPAPFPSFLPSRPRPPPLRVGAWCGGCCGLGLGLGLEWGRSGSWQESSGPW